MEAKELNLASGQRAQRKMLITVAEWVTPSEVYRVLKSAPANWTSDYTNYFTKSGDDYTPVSGSVAPTFVANTYYAKIPANTAIREILGVRTEDSSIELNPDVETVTDILGITYSDVNKTEPQQDLDPLYIIGGSLLSAYLTTAALGNHIDAYNNVFNVYIIAAFIGKTGEYYTVCHSGCSIIPTSLGGDSYNNLPVEIHFSNNITEGTVDKLADDFVFTAKE